ncbi:MAG: glutamate formimidoyltransferase, partial [Bacteroidales bacterium]|nr:glutamate formimidoyltransferase [Bacteroidales bacterium]
KSGAVNVGARNYLIAVNFNLDTTSVRLANSIAFDVREKGRMAPDGITRIPGTLKGCKALGWYIEEYGIAQVSMNITDIEVTPLHVAFEEVCRAAESRGVHVTGTEIIGLVPEKVLLEAGRFYLGGDAEASDLIDAAIESMGLADLRAFLPEEKILEYLI